MLEIVQIQDWINQVVSDIEGVTEPISSEIRFNVNRLLTERYSLLSTQKNSLQKVEEFSDTARADMVIYLAQSIQTLYMVIHIIDPELKYVTVYQGLYNNLIRGLSRDFGNTPAFKSVVHTEKSRIFQEAGDIAAKG